jgi:hypothetical protein
LLPFCGKIVPQEAGKIPIHFHRDDEIPIIINMLYLPEIDKFKTFKDGTKIADFLIR